MKILWISGRVIDYDLCRTTQIALAEGLVGAGHEVTIASPGNAPQGLSFTHIRLERSNIRGFQSRSIAKEARKLNTSKYDLLMVDWRIASYLIDFLASLALPWYLIDRGPPSDSGFLSKMQNRHWRRAWKSALHGMVVSESHRDLVINLTDYKGTLDVIRAGADTKKYQESNINQDEPMFVYLGKVDRNRGVESIPSLALKTGGRLKIIGDGNALEKMKATWSGDNRIIFKGKLDRLEIAENLIDCDIGVLPMPETRSWKVASPLKLAEYAASGLVVAGTKHSGNSVPFDADWLILDKDLEVAMQSAVGRFKDQELRSASRRDAIERMDWSVSVKILEYSLKDIRMKFKR